MDTLSPTSVYYCGIKDMILVENEHANRDKNTSIQASVQYRTGEV